MKDPGIPAAYLAGAGCAGFSHFALGHSALALGHSALGHFAFSHLALGQAFLQPHLQAQAALPCLQQHWHWQPVWDFAQTQSQGQALAFSHLAFGHFAFSHLAFGHSALAFSHLAFGHSAFGHAGLSHSAGFSPEQQQPVTTSAQNAPNTNIRAFFIISPLHLTTSRGDRAALQRI